MVQLKEMNINSYLRSYPEVYSKWINDLNVRCGNNKTSGRKRKRKDFPGSPVPLQGTRVRSLVLEDPTCRGATKPGGHDYRAHTPQRPSLPRACAPQLESSPHSPHERKPAQSREDLAEQQINTFRRRRGKHKRRPL